MISHVEWSADALRNFAMSLLVLEDMDNLITARFPLCIMGASCPKYSKDDMTPRLNYRNLPVDIASIKGVRLHCA